jgi:MFS family permease
VLSDREKIRRLPWSVAHTAFNAAFSQLTFFGPVFLLFLSELGLPKSRIGLLLSLIAFGSMVALFIAPAVARAGVKRVFIAFWGVRKVVTAFFLLTPWVVYRFGLGSTFWYVAVLTALFSLCRAIAETGIYPWFQEIVPPAIRGQYTAVVTIFEVAAGCLALAAAAYVIDRGSGLDRYAWLMGAGVLFGVLCVLTAIPIPGGAPDQAARTAHFAQVRGALRDPNYRRYLGAISLLGLAALSFSFVPLFMKEAVGIGGGQIVRLQISAYVGALLSSYWWGWAADRWGGKPVMLSGIALMLLLPLGWLLMPRHAPGSYPAALAIAFLAGIAGAGRSVSEMRLLYVSIVPPERKIEYLSLYCAWVGFINGLGPLIAGQILEHGRGFEYRLLSLRLDAYGPLFVVSLLLLLAGLLVVREIQVDGLEPRRNAVSLSPSSSTEQRT